MHIPANILLKHILEKPGPLVSPGAWDALSALMIEKEGFQAVSISGAAVTAAQFGLPDKSFLGLSDILQTTLRIVHTVQIPVIVDCEHGYGNALHVIRAVKEMERIGAACVCFQDKDPVSSVLASSKEMENKIRAGVDARREMVLMARTDAFALHGIDEAISRAKRYAAAGADIIFVDGLKKRDDMLRLRDADIGVPLKYNNTIKTDGMQWSSAELYEMGFKLITYSASLQKAALFAIRGVLRELKKNDRTHGYQDKKISQSERAALLGQAVWDKYEETYVKEHDDAHDNC